MALTLHAPATSATLTDRARSTVADLRATIARRALYRRTVRELRDLSNRDLADLGIARCSIKSRAYEAVYKA